jgi:hypothetical protein
MHKKHIKKEGALTYTQNVLFIPNSTKSFPINNVCRETDILKLTGMSSYRKHIWIDNVTSHTDNTAFTENS